MPVTEISRRDVSRLHSAMSKTPVLANKCLIIAASIWNWASRQGEVDATKNPFVGIERYRELRRERLLSADELGRIGDALAQAETDHPWPVASIRLLALTGMRLNEVLTARWDYLDMERGMLHLPDSKTGRKSVVLNAAALEIIASIRFPNAGTYIIPGLRADKPRTTLQAFWKAILRAARISDVRLHDLRHNFATVGAGAQMGLPVIGKLLGHATPATTARYAHLADNPLRAASETIGAQIDAALNRKPPAEIVNLRKDQK
jgi:integrase